jgi:hypothetical protein
MVVSSTLAWTTFSPGFGPKIGDLRPFGLSRAGRRSQGAAISH